MSSCKLSSCDLSGWEKLPRSMSLLFRNGDMLVLRAALINVLFFFCAFRLVVTIWDGSRTTTPGTTTPRRTTLGTTTLRATTPKDN